MGKNIKLLGTLYTPGKYKPMDIPMINLRAVPLVLNEKQFQVLGYQKHTSCLFGPIQF